MRTVILWVVAALPVVWAAITSLPGRLAPWEAATYLVVLGVAVVLVRRRPVTALLVTGAAWLVAFLSKVPADSTVGVGVLSTGLVTVGFLAGRHATAGERGVVALIGAGAAAVTSALVVLGGVDTALAAVSGIAALAAVPWAVGRYRRQYLGMVRAGWERAEQLEREADRAVEQAGLRERARLAAEMHDMVGHELARAALLVGALEVAPALAEEHREAARAARTAVTAAAERLADVVLVLRSGEREPVRSVDEIVARARRSGLSVDVTGDGAEPADPVIARTVHRVLTEAITNAIKHAPGAPVTVHLAGTGDGVELRVVNGAARRAPADAPGSGQGLLGLAERVALVGGRFAAHPLDDGGFEVTAHLPGKPATGSAATGTHRHRAEQRVRRSARRTVLLACAVAGGIVVAVLGYLVFDAATSVLDPADYQRLQLGRPESEVAAVLPARTRVDRPDAAPPVPEGASCRYYSTHANPFDERRLDLFRLCFRDGRLVDKALVERDP
ncbi:sensor histidine kinase [Saccharothrix carnea]|nr:sensor histidine kinase [Saccharothrix carnea]